MIGKAANPRCFKSVNKSALGVQYEAKNKAWMTAKLFREWLEKLNQKFILQNCYILLFVNNCTAHAEVQVSNIKLVFLPPNTTSRLQPMDAGIIQAVKIAYRKKLLRHLLLKMDECNSASELVKNINVLDAILWLKSSWESVQTSTITKCFLNCGFTSDDHIVLSEESNDEEVPYGAEGLMDDLTLVQYAAFDDDLPMFPALNDNWEQQIVARTRGIEIVTEDNQGSDDDDNQVADKIVPEPMTSLKAMEHITVLKSYASAQGDADLLTTILKAEDLAEDHMIMQAKKRNTQTSLHSYFDTV